MCSSDLAEIAGVDEDLRLRAPDITSLQPFEAGMRAFLAKSRSVQDIQTAENPLKDAREIIRMLQFTPSYNDQYFLFDLCEFALSLGLTEDQTDGEYIECMRRIFVQSLRAANSREDVPEVQIIMYHICILWGCMNKRLGRIHEASVALELVVDELKSYLIYHPECTIGKRLDHIARHNLGCELLRDTDILDAIRVSLSLHRETEKRPDYWAGFLSN